MSTGTLQTTAIFAALAVALGCSSKHGARDGGGGSGGISGGGTGGGEAGTSPTETDASSDASSDTSNGTTTCGPSTPPVPVQAGACPTELDDPTGKICNPASWDFQPDNQYQVAVWLRQASLPPVPDCPNDPARDARCASRDGALDARQRLNAQELTCALSALGTRVEVMRTLWYELPYHLTSARPVPVGLAFGLVLSASQIATLAQHPFVEKIEPWPGSAILQKVPAIPPPSECPTEVEPALPKLDGISSIQGEGRQPTVIELRDDGVLPAATGSIDNLWERTILNTRAVSCVGWKLDAIVQDDSPPVPYTGASGDPTAPPLPPASQPAMTLKAFGRGLTWEEAVAIAASPLVESVWTSSGIQFAQARPGCPLDLTGALPMPACTPEQEPIDGKISDADRARFETTSGPIPVLIMVEGGATVCPLPVCSAPPCQPRDRIISRMEAWNLASQRCVRELIANGGGAADPTTLWIIDAFSATLTWPQIQTVAAHPHVISVESSGGGQPPP